jgi:hypothetical protein
MATYKKFNDHDAALIDDIRKEFDALLFVPLTPRDIKLAFEKAVATVVLRRTKVSKKHGR